MSFRRSRSSAAWSERVGRLGDLPARAGVPLWVLIVRCWGRFVQSGYAVDMERSAFFRVTELSDAQVWALVELMTQLGHGSMDILSCVGPHPLRAAIEAHLGHSRACETEE